MGYQKRQFIVVFILGFTGLLILKFFRDILSDPYYEIFGIIFCLIIASSPLIFYFLDSNKDKG
jgi:hypothetical protein